MTTGSGVWRLRYDREDRPRFFEAPNPAVGGPPLVTEFRYDGVGNLVELVSADGQVMRYAYDERDSLVEVRSASGLAIRCEYDDRGDLVRANIVPAAGA